MHNKPALRSLGQKSENILFATEYWFHSGSWLGTKKITK